jgi:hypothetical protein
MSGAVRIRTLANPIETQAINKRKPKTIPFAFAFSIGCSVLCSVGRSLSLVGFIIQAVRNQQ